MGVENEQSCNNTFMQDQRARNFSHHFEKFESLDVCYNAPATTFSIFRNGPPVGVLIGHREEAR